MADTNVQSVNGPLPPLPPSQDRHPAPPYPSSDPTLTAGTSIPSPSPADNKAETLVPATNLAAVSAASGLSSTSKVQVGNQTLQSVCSTQCSTSEAEDHERSPTSQPIIKTQSSLAFPNRVQAPSSPRKALEATTTNATATSSTSRRDHTEESAKALESSSQEDPLAKTAAQRALSTSRERGRDSISSQAAMIQAAAAGRDGMALQPPVRRSMSHRPSRSFPNPAAINNPSATGSSPGNGIVRGSEAEAEERERERLKKIAAAKAAEREHWEKTRGAGSAVMDLLLQEEDGSDSGESDSFTRGSSSRKGKGKAKGENWEAWEVLPSLAEVEKKKHEPQVVPSADKLLSRGISEYTLLPRILGRGKFSTVFLASKPTGPAGTPQLFAVKHTPLFPHHPLIATRLLREPTLLAELAPHPNLVTVNETIRTPGHFYLVEEYLGGYVTLEALIPMLNERPPPHAPALPAGPAAYIMDQLLSAVHAIHHPLQICHRDIKPENILVHPETLQLKLLDFGLATHYSKSEPKLSTCCGSPAFHCPEIVTAMNSPLGSVSYWGPEVDAWTCGISMLRVLTGVRYPIGASHSSVRSMSIRAQRAVATIRDPDLRERVGKLLDSNGERRMRNFEELVGELEKDKGEAVRGKKDFKSTTFIPTSPQHTMHLPLLVGQAAESALNSPVLSMHTPSASRRATPSSSRAPSPSPTAGTFGASGEATPTALSPLVLLNPSAQPPQRVLSFIKYCLRCAGILYHCWPDMGSTQAQSSTNLAWEAQLASLQAQMSAGGVSSGSSNTPGSTPESHPPSLSPTTPLPLQYERPERDPYLHIQIFECVIELRDEPPVGESQEGPPSLVQTIMNAFSFRRRESNRRSSSTPPKPQGTHEAGTRGNMPRPPGTPGHVTPSGSGGPSGQPGDVKCLTFYMVVRFPKRSSRSSAYSRSSSLAGGRSRSRASSAANELSLTPTLSRTELSAQQSQGGEASSLMSSMDSCLTLVGTPGGHAAQGLGMTGLRQPSVDDGTPTVTPRVSRNVSPAVPGNKKLRSRESSASTSTGSSRLRSSTAPSTESAPTTPLGSTTARFKAPEAMNEPGLTIETSPEVLLRRQDVASVLAGIHLSGIASAPGSRSSSRAASRTRTRKSSKARLTSTSTGQRKPISNKVIVCVSDDRAVDAVRKALSVGGTTTELGADMDFGLDEPASFFNQYSSGASTDSIPARLKGFGVSEANEPWSPEGPDQRKRPAPVHRPLSYSGADYSARAGSAEPRRVSGPILPQRKRPSGSGQQVQFKGSGTSSGGGRGRHSASDDTDNDDEPRGRKLGAAASISSTSPMSPGQGQGSIASGIVGAASVALSRRHRAPSQLSTVPLKEESPSKTDPDRSRSRSRRPGGDRAAPYSQKAPSTFGEASEPQSTDESKYSSSEAEDSKMRIADELRRLEAVLSPIFGQRFDDDEAKRQALNGSAGGLERMKDCLRKVEIKDGPEKLTESIEPVSFELFRVLSPALGLIDTSASATTMNVKASEYASETMMILGERASPREIFLAVQERCENLCEEEESGDISETRRRIRSCAKEVIGLVRLLSTVVPRIQTRKPRGFLAALTSLIPRALQKTISRSTWPSPSSLALEALKAICNFAKVAADWQVDCEEKDGPKEFPSNEITALFVSVFTNLLPLLDNRPKSLAEDYYKMTTPRYAFTRPDQEPWPLSHQGLSPTGSNEAMSLLSYHLRELNLDLFESWTGALERLASESGSSLDHNMGLGHGTTKVVEDEESAVQRRILSTIATGAFCLHVRMLAAERPGMAEGWDAERAESNLRSVLPLLRSALTYQSRVAMLTDEEPAEGFGPDMLSDLTLLWLIFSFEALRSKRDAVLAQDLFVPLVQLLSSHTPICPQPCSRHIRLQLLETLFKELREDDDLGLDSLLRAMRTTPFDQMRAALVGVLKNVVAERFSKQGSEESVYTCSKLLDRLYDEEQDPTGGQPFSFPPTAPLPPVSDKAQDVEGPLQELSAFLESQSAILQEVCSLFYLLVKVDPSDRIGMRDQSRGDGVVNVKLLVPLDRFLTLWHCWIEATVSDTKTIKEAGLIGPMGTLSLLSVALERLKEGLASNPVGR
ncbi:hypothetical protein IE53DRAFT_369219 [Violaceomyces palustris]|uniref:Uncharacterized protein n=1 Tax=Violaceomyces palustris TaxID=1673888 RepID=A0ACD0NWB8_9BASI|nr:hypothetical protein IE53DRAFT_369219 [Violaceomyces palustris]